MEKLKKVKLSESHFDYVARNGMTVGMSVCPGTRHTPGPQIRHEVVSVGERYARIRKVHVQDLCDKPTGDYVIDMLA